MALAEVEGAPPGFVEPMFGQRLLAALVDGLLLGGVGLLLRAAFGLPRNELVVVATMAMAAAYSIACTTLTGRTVGKRVLGTRVVDATTGRPPHVGAATTRWLVISGGAVVVGLAPAFEPLAGVWCLVALLPILGRPLHRGLHDRAAGTVVTAARGLRD
jgi:uncharacterized RDD family membrane protein YckC